MTPAEFGLFGALSSAFGDFVGAVLVGQLYVALVLACVTYWLLLLSFGRGRGLTFRD